MLIEVSGAVCVYRLMKRILNDNRREKTQNGAGVIIGKPRISDLHAPKLSQLDHMMNCFESVLTILGTCKIIKTIIEAVQPEFQATFLLVLLNKDCIRDHTFEDFRMPN